MALTKGDIDKIDNLLQNRIDEVELKFESKLVEFKSEFFEKIDPILKRK